MSFAHIIPIMRTPLGIEGFDYRIPAGQQIEVGDVVTIPFRRGISTGLVSHLLTTSRYADQALPIKGKYANLRFPPSFLDLIDSTAARTFSSRPTVLKSWFRTLPKKPKPLTIIPSKHEERGLEGKWLTNPAQELIQRAILSSQQKRVLIVTPWVIRTQVLQASIPHATILHSDLSDSQAFEAWTSFLCKEHGCLISTKIGAWLAIASDLVLLDEPEQDDHKQDELTPRYDARKILLWCAQQGLTRVESLGLTPPLHAQAIAPTIKGETRIHIHHPQGKSAIPLLQADSLQALLDHEGSKIIIHPIRGSLARLTCRDCQWQASCPMCGSGLGADKHQAICRRCRKIFPMPEACALCGGVDLSRSLPGIERLQEVWQKTFPKVEVSWRDTTAKELEASFPDKSLVVVTEVGLLGGGEDIRRRERQCIAIRRLADRVHQADSQLILQAREENASLIQDWLTEEGMKHFAEQERQERQTFGYPPATRVVKVIIRGSQEQAEAWQRRLQSHLKTSSLHHTGWRGPFPAEYQARTRGERHILHLILPPETMEKELIQVLTPFAKDKIIDLDPIAFLR